MTLSRHRLEPGRWRCHAAAVGGAVLAPALVTVAPSGEAVAEPLSGEVHSTRDINGAVAIVRPEAVGQLPLSLPPRGLKATLSSLSHLTQGGTEAIFIPVC